jgi:hypothetical protein
MIGIGIHHAYDASMKAIRLSLVLLVPLAAQNGAGFAGVWNADLAKRVCGGPTPDSLRCRVEQNGESFTVTLRISARSSTEEEIHRLTIGQYTQNQIHGAPMNSRAEWDSGD